MLKKYCMIMIFVNDKIKYYQEGDSKYIQLDDVSDLNDKCIDPLIFIKEISDICNASIFFSHE